MKCPKCGAELEGDSKFCIFCGAKVNHGEDPEGGASGSASVPAAENKHAEIGADNLNTDNDPNPGDSFNAENSSNEGNDLKGSGNFNSINNFIEILRSVSRDKKIFIPGLIAGTLLILIGISRIMSAGTSISSTSFGGDFYTFTYQGIVAISEILASIEVSLGWMIAAVGTAIDVYSLRR